MANQRDDDGNGLSDYGRSNQLIMKQGVLHGATIPCATDFFDQEGSGYFGELEEALMHGVAAGITSDLHQDKKTFGTARPATLDIFPSWPMRFQQITMWDSQPEEGSTDSGSVQNSQPDSESPVSRKPSSEQFEELGVVRTSSDAAAVPQAASGSNQQLRTQAKTQRRLAQNREAARKSRLRKKAYIQQLESSRMKLSQLEQLLQRNRTQGLFLGGGGASENINSGFDMEYSRWLEEKYKYMIELRRGLQNHLPDGDLSVIVDECLTLYDALFQLKATAANSDVFHVITGSWTSPAEQCFLWMGGFRPSELLKVIIPKLDPLAEQQLIGIYNLQQSCRQAEDALSQGLEQFHHSLASTVAGDSLIQSTNAGNLMSHMTLALGKLADLEGFVRQADNLRQQSLHQMRRILTIRQAARSFLVIGEYYSRLRAISSLWASRPKENLINENASLAVTTDQQILQPVHPQHSAF